ncbi:hypothetical protein QWZ08_12635 [Ferruginibacter paludis]|uniref:hypothetical protein n=1 Tax=Ferruginibacter paludis TaxID=1310417 RepID=UPI0025B60B4F|nr:hypothetical protein [Ferruginibacter paludis]MDN3656483.1 hypothetical protein [Ferruginibacter paludis]
MKLDKIKYKEGEDLKRNPKNKDSIHIVIASPSDAVSERKMLLDHLETKFRKDGHESHCGFRIIVHGWEDLASQPGYGQDLINAKLIKECDFVVTIFKHKLGTPTKNLLTGVQRAESGTAEELLQSLDKSKKDFPIGMLYYYSKAPVISVIEKSLKSIQKEFLRLESFKKTIQDKILYKSFENDEDLMKKVLQDLEKNIKDYFIDSEDKKDNKFIENRTRQLLVQPNFIIQPSATNKIIRLYNIGLMAFSLIVTTGNINGEINLIINKNDIEANAMLNIFLGDKFDYRINPSFQIVVGYADIDGRRYQQTYIRQPNLETLSLPELLGSN